MSAQPDRFESDHRSLMSTVDNAERRTAEAKSLVKEYDFEQLMKALDLDAGTVAIEYVNDLMHGILGDADVFKAAVSDLVLRLEDVKADAAVAVAGELS